MAFTPKSAFLAENLLFAPSLRVSAPLRLCVKKKLAEKTLRGPRSFAKLGHPAGEMAEWFKAHAWKA